MLTLAEAVKSGRLQEFIAQEEARGVEAGTRKDFDRLIGAAVKPPREEDRTSRSASADGSTGKKIRRGSGPYTSR